LRFSLSKGVCGLTFNRRRKPWTRPFGSRDGLRLLLEIRPCRSINHSDMRIIHVRYLHSNSKCFIAKFVHRSLRNPQGHIRRLPRYVLCSQVCIGGPTVCNCMSIAITFRDSVAAQHSYRVKFSLYYSAFHYPVDGKASFIK
jgi:hypothetical protein